MENHDIWQLKWKNQNRSKFGLSTVHGLLNKTLKVFSTFLVKVRPNLKTSYSILSKCSTFGSWREWSDNFWKNSPSLMNMPLIVYNMANKFTYCDTISNGKLECEAKDLTKSSEISMMTCYCISRGFLYPVDGEPNIRKCGVLACWLAFV